MCCNAIITTHIIIDNIYRKRSNEQEHQPASPCHLENIPTTQPNNHRTETMVQKAPKV